ncbi:hypothetical protein Pcinc_024341 [Petrolisthes cinctipes]|uniref:Glucose-methanol-choline oxidoreductase N-terminal domain-containing protein n=1 Tax=Petrolisthes cinctipes TaxID=88211 RepID=A0AAE1FB44_PETCI|nr:hypothetical protein Pcinc_024341 [Petrolisthes cinctipes]
MPVGRVLGGSSVLNWMMYVRGNRRDYDNWAKLGNTGWSYQDVLRYFKKAEDYTGTRNTQTAAYHGDGGPLTVDDKRWHPPITEDILRAGRELGLPTIDPNGPEQIGFSIPDMTQRNGKRGSTDRSYLRPAASRPNLHVALNALVTKVIFDNNKRATGVEFEQLGLRRRIYVRREVILSAGAFGSPKILMLSGVGPAKHLRKHRIPVIENLRGVGRNLHDHPSIFGLTWTVNRGSAGDLFRIFNPQTVVEYIHKRQGPLSVPLGVEVNAWIRSEGRDDPMWPELQFLFISLTPAVDFGLLVTDGIGFRRSLFNTYFAPLKGREGFNIGPMLTRPLSRGTVKLSSNNPKHPPIINPNFLSHPRDVEVFVKGIKFAMAVGNTTTLKQRHGAKFYDRVLPGCEKEIFGSDKYWVCYTRTMAQTTYHPTGTCKMAPASDKKGVVDPRLRVRGVSGLRVIDGSIMPYIVSANLNAPIIMIGEKGADLIKQDWGLVI